MRYEKFIGPEFVGQAIEMVSEDKLSVALVKNVILPEQCDAITANFLASAHRKKRGDNVPGYILGATHYGKAPAQYFDECISSRAHLDEAFSGEVDPMKMVYEELRKQVGSVVRPSIYDGRYALNGRIVEWLPDGTANDDFLLRPHEDLSQVDCDRNDGWEIRSAVSLVALNFYACVQSGEGRLRVYDCVPKPSLRKQLGLDGVGYPYPTELFHDKSFIDLAVEAGDLAVINGKYIHAVTKTSQRRVVVNGFVASLPETQDYVYWT